MRRVCLFVLAVVLLAGISSCTAIQPHDAGSDHLSDYLHTRRLPLVEARTIINDSGERSLLLYGFVATDYGKQDAEVKARDFVEDPDLTIVNRIVVRPELLTMGAPPNPAPDAAATVSAADNAPQYDQDQATPDQAASASYASLPDNLGTPQDYANQERDDEFTFGGVPLVLAILGSGAIVPPIIAPPFGFGRVYGAGFGYYPHISPSVYPPINPPIFYAQPPMIGNAYIPPNTFPAPGRAYYPSGFRAGGSPAFGPAPFPSAFGPGFTGFHGFSSFSGSGGHLGGGFGGRR
jgi:hypothetical protein